MAEKLVTVPRVCPICQNRSFVSMALREYNNWIKDKNMDEINSLDAIDKSVLITGVCAGCQEDEFAAEV